MRPSLWSLLSFVERHRARTSHRSGRSFRWGVVLPPDIVETTMVFVDGLSDGGTSSLQRDIHAGHPSELEAWSGAVVRLGTHVGVATPVHRVIHDVVRLLADQRKLRPDR
ncbi:MAG: ketopantoate reductase family protein [Jiangellaceae bacterium]